MNPLLSIPEAARELKVCQRTLRRLYQSGELRPAIHRHKLVRFSREEIERFKKGIRPMPQPGERVIKLQIDEGHSRVLLSGKPIAIKIPEGAKTLELRLAAFHKPSDFVKAIDVFFNGRPA